MQLSCFPSKSQLATVSGDTNSADMNCLQVCGSTTRFERQANHPCQVEVEKEESLVFIHGRPRVQFSFLSPADLCEFVSLSGEMIGPNLNR
jgi:hypothetical protein